MKSLLPACLLLVLAAPVFAAGKPEIPWSMNATAIEACSCPMFCQCYFSTGPAAHSMDGMQDEHFCRFNNAYKVNRGVYGTTRLDGVKFWMYGDLGAEFTDGEMDWAMVTFDKHTTNQQRQALGAIIAKLFPVKWKSLQTTEGDIEWVAGIGEAYATLDGGKTAEVRLSNKTLNRNTTVRQTTIQNLKYWGAARNSGFVLMPNTIEALRTGDKPFEFKGTNGFMITIDMNWRDYTPLTAASQAGM
jgi:hypothetical protein